MKNLTKLQKKNLFSRKIHWLIFQPINLFCPKQFTFNKSQLTLYKKRAEYIHEHCTITYSQLPHLNNF